MVSQFKVHVDILSVAKTKRYYHTAAAVVQTQETPTPTVQSLRYSVHQSERTRAYPGEIVVLSCLIYGNRLVWNITMHNSSVTHTFVDMDEQGKGFTLTANKFRFSGVLDVLIPAPNNNALPVCQSTMAVIPDSGESNVRPFDITCRSGFENKTKSVKYEVSEEAFVCAGNAIR